MAATTPNSGDSAYPSVAQAGTVKATFTWVHDTPGDAPPADVYVLQSGYAKWNLLADNRTLSQPRASVQNVAFSFGRKARIYLAQTQTASGTADDGLGHAQVITYRAPNGQIGISQGDKPVLFHPSGDTLVVPDVTLSASATPPTNRTYVAEWHYSAQILNLRITCNGQDITTPKPAYQAKAGQNTALSFSGVSTGLTVTNPSWTLPDKYVKDWIHSDDSAGPPDPLPAAELSNASIPKLFWISGGNKAVSFTATINGTAITLKGNINVDKPSYDFLATPGTTGGVRLNVDAFGDALLSLGVYTQTAPQDSGIIFTSPNKPNPNTTLTTIQVVTGTTRKVVDNNGITHTWTPTSGFDALNLGADSPDQGAYNTEKEITMDESFDDWLMYHPDTGGDEHKDWIYVPLKKLSWSWKGHAVRRGATWVATTTVNTADTPSDLVSATLPQTATGTDTFDYPKWNQKVGAGHFDPPR